MRLQRFGGHAATSDAAFPSTRSARARAVAQERGGVLPDGGVAAAPARLQLALRQQRLRRNYLQ